MYYWRLTLQNFTFCPHSVFVFCMDLRTNIVFPCFREWFLGALAELWKATISCKICPSAWINLDLTGRLFLKFDI